jgi:hypothetical protein
MKYSSKCARGASEAVALDKSGYNILESSGVRGTWIITQQNRRAHAGVIRSETEPNVAIQAIREVIDNVVNELLDVHKLQCGDACGRFIHDEHNVHSIKTNCRGTGGHNTGAVRWRRSWTMRWCSRGCSRGCCSWGMTGCFRRSCRRHQGRGHRWHRCRRCRWRLARGS